MKTDLANRSVSREIDGVIPTYLMQVAGIDSVSIKANGVAGSGKKEAIVDIAMCIDATGSMGSTLAAVKDNALSFDEELIAAIEARGAQLDKVNVRPIYFRDFDSDRASAISYGSMYELPEDRTAFKGFVSNQRPYGGGDLPEAGLECFYAAMKTKWSVPAYSWQDVYPVIAIWTDAAADSPRNSANISAGQAYGVYPSGMPRTYSGLKRVWNDEDAINQDRKTVVFFGPHRKNGWDTVRRWDGFKVGGTIYDGNRNMVELLADAIYEKMKPPRLMR